MYGFLFLMNSNTELNIPVYRRWLLTIWIVWYDCLFVDFFLSFGDHRDNSAGWASASNTGNLFRQTQVVPRYNKQLSYMYAMPRNLMVRVGYGMFWISKRIFAQHNLPNHYFCVP